jgi:S-adenosylmethionine hydrolase
VTNCPVSTLLRRIFGAALLVLAVTPGVGAGASPDTPALKVIAFMTDFDVKDDAVGMCKAVMDGVAPGVRIIDITHEVEPYNIAAAARILGGFPPYLPADAVFVVVVDPGVGSTRKAIIAKSKRGQYFVLPDNGLLTLVQDGEGIIAAREITNEKWMIGARRSSTFHGRDIFSPAAAHLARGEDWSQAGPALEVAKLVRLDLKTATLDEMGVNAESIGLDGPYGNLILNLDAALFAKLGYRIGDSVPVAFDGESHEFMLANTFSDVAPGKELLYVDSRGRLTIAINQGNFAEVYKIGAGAKVFIPRKPPR